MRSKWNLIDATIRESSVTSFAGRRKNALKYLETSKLQYANYFLCANGNIIIYIEKTKVEIRSCFPQAPY